MVLMSLLHYKADWPVKTTEVEAVNIKISSVLKNQHFKLI